MYAAIVFLPLLASAIAGLFGRSSARAPASSSPPALLFVSAALSLVAFNDVALEGHKYIMPILPWIHSGDFAVDWTLRVDTLTAVMLVVVTASRRSCISIPSATCTKTRTGRASSPICRCSPSPC